MNATAAPPAQQKQNLLSAALICLNVILAFIFFTCTPQTEDNFFISLFLVAVLGVLLLVFFVFTYKGKAPLLSKWLLFIFFLVTALYGAFILYAIALGKAFQH